MQTILDLATARRAAVGERDCYVDWIDALRSVPGNPWRADSRDFGNATVIVCPGCDAQIVNRCFGLDTTSAGHLPEILSYFAEQGVAPRFDLDPYGMYGSDRKFFPTLAGHGLLHDGFHQALIGHIEDIPDDGAEDESMTIAEVGPEATAAYAMIHERVWGPGRLITALLPYPAFPCFLATVDGKPAALGVLHVRGKTASMANGITLPEFRGRGLQVALLRCRIRAARALGCDLIVSQADPRGTSMRNQVRSGLSIAGTKAIWNKL